MVAAPERAAALRAAHDPGAPGFLLGNVSRVGLAKKLQSAGYLAIGTSSAGLADDLGVKDGEPGLEALLENAANIAVAVDLPVTADLENGRARDTDGIAEVYRRAAEIGLAGASIEDSAAPDGALFSVDEACRRLQAAVAAARKVCPGFMITARTEVWCTAQPSLEETTSRLRAYEEAGADVVFAPGLPWEALEKVLRQLTRPLNVLVSPGDAERIPSLFQLGVKRISLGAGLVRLGIAAEAAAAAKLLEAAR